MRVITVIAYKSYGSLATSCSLIISFRSRQTTSLELYDSIELLVTFCCLPQLLRNGTFEVVVFPKHTRYHIHVVLSGFLSVVFIQRYIILSNSELLSNISRIRCRLYRKISNKILAREPALYHGPRITLGCPAHWSYLMITRLFTGIVVAMFATVVLLVKSVVETLYTMRKMIHSP